MSKYIKKYRPFIDAGIREAITYKTNWIFMMIGNILGCFISFFLWKSVFLSSEKPDFMGFSIEQMTIYIFVTFITNNMISSGGTYDIGEEIKDGSIAMRMLKPISYNFTFLFQEIGNKLINVVLVFIPLILGVEIYRYVTTGVLRFSFINFTMYVISIMLAYLVNFFFNICYGFTAFIFKNLWGSNMLKNCLVNFLSGVVIPLAFLPLAVRKIFLILPFASLNYTPVMIYMGKYCGKEALCHMTLQFMWCIVFWIFSKIIWHMAVKYLCIQGG